MNDNDKEKQIKDIFIYSAPKVIAGLLPFVVLPFFTRVLSVADYGIYALAEVYAIFLTGFVNFGLVASYERNFFQYIERRQSAQLLYSTLVFIVSGFLIAFICTVLFSHILAKIFIGIGPYQSLFLWVCVSTFLIGFKQCYLIFFKNHGNSKDYVIYTLVEALIGVFFSFIFVMFLKVGIVGLAWGQCLASGIILIILTVKFLKTMPFLCDKVILKESLKIGAPLVPGVFVKVISGNLNKYIIVILNSVGGVGILSVAQKIANFTFIFMTTLQNVFNPQIYRMMFSNSDRAGHNIGKYLTPFVYVSVFSCLCVALFAQELMKGLTTPDFFAAAPIISILSIYYAVLFFGKITGLQFMYVKKTWISSLFTLLDIGLGFLISLPLIIHFGVAGAAWGLVVNSLILNLGGFSFAQMLYRIYWEYKKIAGMYGYLFISIMGMFFFQDKIRFIDLLIYKVCIVCGYVVMGMIMCIITKQTFLIVVKSMCCRDKPECF